MLLNKLYAFGLNMPYKHKNVNVMLFFPYQLIYPPLFVRSFLNHSKSKGRAEGFNIPAERLLNLVLAAGKEGWKANNFPIKSLYFHIGIKVNKQDYNDVDVGSTSVP